MALETTIARALVTDAACSNFALSFFLSMLHLALSI